MFLPQIWLTSEPKKSIFYTCIILKIELRKNDMQKWTKISVLEKKQFFKSIALFGSSAWKILNSKFKKFWTIFNQNGLVRAHCGLKYFRLNSDFCPLCFFKTLFRKTLHLQTCRLDRQFFLTTVKNTLGHSAVGSDQYNLITKCNKKL